jgi:hypothetical protein
LPKASCPTPPPSVSPNWSGRAGGCAFAIDPSLAATNANVFWTPDVDPGTVIATAVPLAPAIESIIAPDLDASTARSGAGGLSIVHGRGTNAVRLFLTANASPAAPLVALVPLGADGLDRIEAVSRLWRAINGRKVPPDPRLTTQQRRRLRRMLQAIDGHTEGATYREIAETLFGPARIAEASWKTSALRDVTIDLVKDGLVLIAGGYRKLLRKRRRR